MQRHQAVVLTLLACLAGMRAFAAGEEPAAERYPFVFRDVGKEMGIFPHIQGIRAHAGLWGDVNGDGWIDYFAGAFFLEGTTRSVLFLNQQGKKFVPDGQETLKTPSRATGGVFADLDNDGDLDFYLSNNTKPLRSESGEDDEESPARARGKSEADLEARRKDRLHQAAPSLLFRNEGGGKFTDVSKAGGNACEPFGSRSVVPLDIDGDGLLDFLRGGGRISRDERVGSRLYRNLGNLKFKNVTVEAGFPDRYGGVSCAAADVNNDTYPDIFFASSWGGHRLLLNDGTGKFTEAPGTYEVFSARFQDEIKQGPCGPCFADVNRDGLLDLVVGQSTKRPWRDPIAPRLYLNRGIRDGTVVFEDVTERAGLTPLTLKCPHMEIQDFDNDGWPDIYCGMFKFAGGKTYPVIFRNLGIRDGLIRFREDAQAVNDYPTEEDRNLTGTTTTFYDKMVRERKVMYAVAAPSGDYDRDGRLDIFAAEWWAENPSVLLHNETPGGHWLEVVVRDAPGVNRMGLGAKVTIYEAGQGGEKSAILGCRDIGIGFGYSSSHEAMAHFGLGDRTACDVEVVLPHKKGTIRKQGVQADRRITLP